VGGQKNRIPIEMRTVKTRLMGFQMGTRSPLGIGLETMCITFWQRLCLHCIHAGDFVGVAEFKMDRGMNAAEKISRQSTI
jgi:hypothetical protein